MKLDLTKVPLNEYGHVQTKRGMPAKILCLDRKTAYDYGVLGLVLIKGKEDHESVYCWKGDGTSNPNEDYDLIPVPKKRTVWVNVYGVNDIVLCGSTKDTAERCAAPGRIACVSLEFEEGEGL